MGLCLSRPKGFKEKEQNKFKPKEKRFPSEQRRKFKVPTKYTASSSARPDVSDEEMARTLRSLPNYNDSQKKIIPSMQPRRQRSIKNDSETPNILPLQRSPKKDYNEKTSTRLSGSSLRALLPTSKASTQIRPKNGTMLNPSPSYNLPLLPESKKISYVKIDMDPSAGNDQEGKSEFIKHKLYSEAVQNKNVPHSIQIESTPAYTSTAYSGSYEKPCPQNCVAVDIDSTEGLQQDAGSLANIAGQVNSKNKHSMFEQEGLRYNEVSKTTADFAESHQLPAPSTFTQGYDDKLIHSNSNMNHINFNITATTLPGPTLAEHINMQDEENKHYYNGTKTPNNEDLRTNEDIIRLTQTDIVEPSTTLAEEEKLSYNNDNKQLQNNKITNWEQSPIAVPAENESAKLKTHNNQRSKNDFARQKFLFGDTTETSLSLTPQNHLSSNTSLGLDSQLRADESIMNTTSCNENDNERNSRETFLNKPLGQQQTTIINRQSEIDIENTTPNKPRTATTNFHSTNNQDFNTFSNSQTTINTNKPYQQLQVNLNQNIPLLEKNQINPHFPNTSTQQLKTTPLGSNRLNKCIDENEDDNMCTGKIATDESQKEIQVNLYQTIQYMKDNHSLNTTTQQVIDNSLTTSVGSRSLNDERKDAEMDTENVYIRHTQQINLDQNIQSMKDNHSFNTSTQQLIIASLTTSKSLNSYKDGSKDVNMDIENIDTQEPRHELQVQGAGMDTENIDTQEPQYELQVQDAHININNINTVEPIQEEPVLDHQPYQPPILSEEIYVRMDNEFQNIAENDPCLIDVYTDEPISVDAFRRVLTILRAYLDKAVPFEQLIEKFTEIEGSNEHYYIEESLRRIVYKLDSMFDEIGNVELLRSIRKMVYKFIFALFGRLDSKVKENQERLKYQRPEE